ncbi:MAG: 4-hydroxy-tetrahydrodipicolinate reductase [Gammaproteobacteria bacterium]|nr:4-hydroxy-tetrahydrodipicolinate reductase [Gammaproteobacteria bacterium]
MSIKILVNGANGRMGQIAVPAIQADTRFELVAQGTRNDDLGQLIKKSGAQVVIDFTIADHAYQNTKIIIAAGAHPVIGTTGFLPDQVKELQAECKAKKLGGIIAPNFSLSVILLMRFAQQAAKYFPHAEIIELHHDKKREAPSGTAVKTAQLIAAVRDNKNIDDIEIYKGARGASVENVPVHSVRLPGLMAHEEILFGAEGELLTLRTDVFNRSAYIPGIVLACEKVLTLKELVYGLEDIL